MLIDWCFPQLQPQRILSVVGSCNCRGTSMVNSLRIKWLCPFINKPSLLHHWGSRNTVEDGVERIKSWRQGQGLVECHLPGMAGLFHIWSQSSCDYLDNIGHINILSWRNGEIMRSWLSLWIYRHSELLERGVHKACTPHSGSQAGSWFAGSWHCLHLYRHW